MIPRPFRLISVKKINVCRVIFLVLMLLGAAAAWAQLDPSSALLLRSGTPPTSKENLDSSRYTIRPESSTKKEQVHIEQVKEEKKAKTTTSPVEQTQLIETLIPEEKKPASEGVSQIEELDEKARPVGKQVKELFLGGSEEEIESYRRMLHPLDTRNNLIEIILAPAFIYNESKSSYWFRDYVSSSPGLVAGANLWLTPFFGIQSGFQTNLNGEIRGNATGTKNIPIEQEWFDAGLRFRKFFGLSRKSSQLVFGIDYSEYIMRVPSDDTNRIGSKSSGVRLNIEANLPSSATHSWILGAEIIPRETHDESKTGINVKSGSKNESTLIGFSFGGLYTFDRSNQVFWKISHRYEKNIFDGQANTTDPVTSIKPEGVTVDNSFTVFQLGYRWGR